MTLYAFACVVVGRPVPQGSMVASYNRKLGVAHVHNVQGGALAAWRATIRNAMYETGAVVMDGPVRLSIQFGIPRPRYHYRISGGKLLVKAKYENARPSVAPDIDKLVRAVADALTGVCYRDDSQVVEIFAAKVYANTTFVEVRQCEESPSLRTAPEQLSLRMAAHKAEDSSAG